MVLLFSLFRGEGLGREKQGMTSHIKVSKKDDVTGIGHNVEKSKDIGDQWWTNAFDHAAKFLGAPSSDSDTESDNESEISGLDQKQVVSLQRDLKSYTEEDKKLFLACKGRRLGRRANVLQLGKMRREQLSEKMVDNKDASENGGGEQKKRKKSKKEKKHKKKSKK